MKRKITEHLIRWKEKATGRMPLLVYGARQVGKTYIIREFGEHHYKNVTYFNLETTAKSILSLSETWILSPCFR